LPLALCIETPLWQALLLYRIAFWGADGAARAAPRGRDRRNFVIDQGGITSAACPIRVTTPIRTGVVAGLARVDDRAPVTRQQRRHRCWR
jgi:hypothetical protein